MKTLIISPHADDEVLGAYSFMGPNTHVYFVSFDESMINGKRPDPEERLREIENLYDYLHMEYTVGDFPINNYYNYIAGIAWDIEEEINSYKPDIILIPYPDTNQDHQAVHKACMVALRSHDKNYFVPTVLEYESPGGYQWGKPFEPNYFKELDLEGKINAYRFYESQFRPHRDEFVLTLMASHRGRQSGFHDAEGFKVIRLCQGKAQKSTGN